MIAIDNKAKCCGCTACANICPKQCLTMIPDTEGFLYPKVDKEHCIGCNLCDSVCPMKKPAEVSERLPVAYEVQLLDNVILKNSASGGFFAALCQYIFSNDGVCCGAAYDEEFNVQHRLACKEDGYEQFSGSKYVQSDLGRIFEEIKSNLEQGTLCVFSGTACQVSGLKKYLKKEYENLITVDLVCAGVPSPMLWRNYLDKQEQIYASKVKYANFRHKTFGYQCSTLRLEFKNGKVYSCSGRIDPMMYFFVNGMAKRPSCYECPIKGIKRCSDFTVFDGWNAEKLIGISDDDKGYTALMVHTEKANKILKQLRKDMKIYPVNLEEAVKLDGIMVNGQPKYSQNRKNFYKILGDEGIDGCIAQFMIISKRDLLVEKLKPILYRLGIIRIAKIIRKKVER